MSRAGEVTVHEVLADIDGDGPACCRWCGFRLGRDAGLYRRDGVDVCEACDQKCEEDLARTDRDGGGDGIYDGGAP